MSHYKIDSSEDSRYSSGSGSASLIQNSSSSVFAMAEF
jgi:hypothetical protein